MLSSGLRCAGLFLYSGPQFLPYVFIRVKVFRENRFVHQCLGWDQRQVRGRSEAGQENETQDAQSICHSNVPKTVGSLHLASAVTTHGHYRLHAAGIHRWVPETDPAAGVSPTNKCSRVDNMKVKYRCLKILIPGCRFFAGPLGVNLSSVSLLSLSHLDVYWHTPVKSMCSVWGLELGFG